MAKIENLEELLSAVQEVDIKSCRAALKFCSKEEKTRLLSEQFSLAEYSPFGQEDSSEKLTIREHARKSMGIIHDNEASRMNEILRYLEETAKECGLAAMKIPRHKRTLISPRR